ncbi:MAG: ParD-like family protein [Alphaproteobacteria bacterium]
MTTINLSDELVEEAKKYASVFSRSTPKQIEYWAKIGKIAEENPDLPYAFIKDVLLAMDDPNPSTPFEFTELDDPRG